MKHTLRNISFIAIIFAACISCEKENLPPTCNITSPDRGEEFIRGEKINIIVNAKDPDGTIEVVKIILDGQTLQSLESSPYKFELDTKRESIGDHEIKAFAFDDGQLEAESVVNITIKITEASVLTKDAKNITHSSATCTGEILNNGGSEVIESGICWNTSSNPTKNDNIATAESGIGEFTVELTKLNSITTYYYRAYAINGKNVSYGEEKSFKTEIEVFTPTIETLDANNITTVSTHLQGNVVFDGNANTEVAFYWSKTNINPGESDSIIKGETANNNTFYANLNNLNPNTTYYYKAFGTNKKGTGKGNAKSFTTLNPVQTVEASNITYSSAKINGKKTLYGNITNTTQGLYWSKTNKEPNENDNIEVVNTPTEDFNTTLEQLEPYTRYYYRAFLAINDCTFVGEVESFATYEVIYFTDSRDNKRYKTIEVGEQTWMAENLSYKSNNGSWAYNNDENNVITLGRLYSWETAMAVCPSGWHLPDVLEWRQLIDFVNEQKGPFREYQHYKAGEFEGWIEWIDLGNHLKTLYSWWGNGNKTNVFGFSGLPAGRANSLRGGWTDGDGHHDEPYFIHIYKYGNWWSSSDSFIDKSLYSLSYSLTYDNGNFREHYSASKDDCAYSVRCVKD